MSSRKKTFRRKTQKLYKMKGCNKNKSRKHFFGGDSKASMNLAYPSTNVPTIPNPFLAYTGKVGGGGDLLNAAAYPSKGPLPTGFNFLNPQSTQRGGCGCGLKIGGKYKKRKGKTNKMRGGFGNNGIPYSNGVVGSPWTPSVNTWPGVDGISGNNNYLELNKYHTDPQTAMIATGAQRPFSGGRRRRRQKGGAISNLLSQDFINVGRQLQYGLGSVHNAMKGYSAPVNPLPWKGQLQKPL